jgi:hypothetical protein
MTDSLEDILQLVAQGRLTPDEAAEVIDALQAAGVNAGEDGDADRGIAGDATSGAIGGRPRALRLEVSEGGRKVVNLRVPLSLGRMGLDRIPGLSADDLTSIRHALDEGVTGPILSVDEDADGNGVRIVLE